MVRSEIKKRILQLFQETLLGPRRQDYDIAEDFADSKTLRFLPRTVTFCL